MTPLRAFLARQRRIALEANPRYAEVVDVFSWLERAPNTGVTSTLTMTELLVQPYRLLNEPLVNRYYALLSSIPNPEWIAPDLPIADTAARLGGATAILTNDSEMARVTEIEVGVLDRLL